MNVVAVEGFAQAGEVIHPDGLPASSWFFNINSVDDLCQAEAYFPGFIA